jgi:hypothetical protein
MAAKPAIVTLLLENGADPYATDILGNNSFILASGLGRADNLRLWLKRFPTWNLEQKNIITGLSVCTLSVSFSFSFLCNTLTPITIIRHCPRVYTCVQIIMRR